jgi:hypothetical protein
MYDTNSDLYKNEGYNLAASVGGIYGTYSYVTYLYPAASIRFTCYGFLRKIHLL